MSEEEVCDGGVFSDGEQDLVGGVEAGGGGDGGADFAKDGHCVGELALWEVGEGDGDDGVAGGGVVG